MELYEKETVTCAEMQELEKAADAAGLSYYQMMENAGSAAAEMILDQVSATAGRIRAAVFCGKGNNGGDGFVVARKLSQAGWKVVVILVEGEPVTEDAKANFRWVLDNLEVMNRRAAAATGGYDVVVDAIYGTGFHGTLRAEGQNAVELMNKWGYQKADVFALDVPSGLPGDYEGGEEEPVPQQAVVADCTISFHAKKPVHNHGKELSSFLGDVKVADIGIQGVLKEA